MSEYLGTPYEFQCNGRPDTDVADRELREIDPAMCVGICQTSHEHSHDPEAPQYWRVWLVAPPTYGQRCRHHVERLERAGEVMEHYYGAQRLG